MRISLIDQIGLTREMPLLAEATEKWLAQLAADYHKIPSTVRVAENEADVGPGEVIAYLQPSIDVDGAAAYHDEDDHGRQRIFCALDAVPSGNILLDQNRGGESLLGLLQHEAGEADVDPTADVWRQQPFRDRRSGRTFNLICQEACDPVQEVADSMTLKDGTVVDRIAYVLPAWFDARRAQSVRVDSHGALSEPLTLAPGGYQIAAMVSGERDIFAELVEHHEIGLAAWRKKAKGASHARTARRIAKFNAMFAKP